MDCSSLREARCTGGAVTLIWNTRWTNGAQIFPLAANLLINPLTSRSAPVTSTEKQQQKCSCNWLLCGDRSFITPPCSYNDAEPGVSPEAPNFPVTTAAALTFNVLVDDALQPVQPLDNPQGFTFAVLLQLSLRLAAAAALRNFRTAVGHVVGDPTDVQQAHDVGHTAQDYACRHQSFSSPCAQHRDVPPWAGRWMPGEDALEKCFQTELERVSSPVRAHGPGSASPHPPEAFSAFHCRTSDTSGFNPRDENTVSR